MFGRHHQRDHVGNRLRKLDVRFFRVHGRKISQAFHRGFDVAADLFVVHAVLKLGVDDADVLRSRGQHPLDPVDTRQRLLHAPSDAVLDLRRGGAGVGHRDIDDAGVNSGEQLCGQA